MPLGLSRGELWAKSQLYLKVDRLVPLSAPLSEAPRLPNVCRNVPNSPTTGIHGPSQSVLPLTVCGGEMAQAFGGGVHSPVRMRPTYCNPGAPVLQICPMK